MFDVQVISASPSQNPIVSPYQRGTGVPRYGTAPSILNVRPTCTCVMKLRATPVRICTSSGVTMTWCGLIPGLTAAKYQRRMNPSGQQYVDGHCGALVTAWW